MRSDLITPDEYIPRELVELTHRSVTPEQFERLCSEYSDWRLELTSSGELIVMPGTGGLTGIRNSNLTYQLEAWSQIDGTGVCFDSSTIFALPNQARRSPDASWVKRERWDSLTERQQETFPPICPDFVVELRSPTDRLPTLCDKMLEYLENGALLGWLIDPFEFRVYVFRPDHELVILENPDTVSADPLLPGFTLNVMKLW
ncbi:MAG TPA: Uma2 family endonuclease [Pyrinomonadaceae bacterium]|nr:Uma2 family endonuclease [Pyrinomonadaceae bacterium]